MLDLVFFGYLSMREVLFSTFNSAVTQSFTAWLLYRSLDIARKRTYIACEAVIIGMVIPFHSLFPSPVALLLTLSEYVFVPLLASRGSRIYRVMMCLFTISCAYITELVMACVWVLTTGEPYSFEALLAGVPWSLLIAPVYLTVEAAFFFLARRALSVAGGSWASDNMALFARADSSSLVIGAFALECISLYCILALTFRDVGVPDFSFESFMLCALAALAFLATFASLVWLARFVRGWIEHSWNEARIESLERQVEEALVAYEDVADAIDAAARFRHDLRNQVQVALALAERHDADRARAQLVELSETLRRAGEGCAPAATGEMGSASVREGVVVAGGVPVDKSAVATEGATLGEGPMALPTEAATATAGEGRLP